MTGPKPGPEFRPSRGGREGANQFSWLTVGPSAQPPLMPGDARAGLAPFGHGDSDA